MIMKARYGSFVLIVVAVLLNLTQPSQAAALPAARQNPRLGDGDVSPQDYPTRAWLPIIQKPPLSCYTGQTYYQGIAYRAETLPIIPAAQHPDKNLSMRSPYRDVSSTYPKAILNLGSQAADSNAPKLYGLFSPVQYNPTVVTNTQVHNWDWATMQNGAWLDPNACPVNFCPQVSLVWFQSEIGQTIYVPNSGYRIGGNPNMEVLVLFADSDQITLKFTREDTVATGYTLHIEGICVDANLLALYQALDQNGTGPRYNNLSFNLPNLWAGQAIGVAKGTSFGVAIRDVGTFMDPRNYPDWWVH